MSGLAGIRSLYTLLGGFPNVYIRTQAPHACLHFFGKRLAALLF